MRNHILLVSILALAAAGSACKKDKSAPTVPSAALDEETTDEKQVVNPTLPDEPPTPAEPGETTMRSETLDDGPIPVPPTDVLAGRNPAPPERETLFVDPGADEPMAVDEVIAQLAPTRGSKTRGTVRFRETSDGLEVVADVTGLPKGPHAFHVHIFGDCSAPDATSAGDHFHFHGSSLAPDEHMITGNLGELTGDAAGKATHTGAIKDAAMHGKFSIVGRSVVIHEKGNDPTKTPDGGAGKRLACGVIGVAAEPTTAPETPETPKPPAPKKY
jgi:superoxide dismutase, Cu-Zn family